MSERDNPYGGSYGGGYSGGFGGPTQAQPNAGAVGGQPSAGAQTVSFGKEGPSASGSTAGLVKDTTTAGFVADVIQESRRQPVLVDFWAPWCGPCKQLTPILEKAVTAAGGRVKLVKLNIDDHPSIPGQMGIQSIPAVIAFVDGRPADGFMGAVPESQVTEFIDRLTGGAADPQADAIEATLEEAQRALDQGDINAAAERFSAILQVEPGHAKALAGLAECMLQAGDISGVKELLAGLEADQRKDPDIVSIEARIAQAEEVTRLGDPTALVARLDADPNDHAARADLAKILNVKGERLAAADELLTIMRKDREWDDDGARRLLLSFFEAWGPTDPATLTARRRLSSILFS